MVGKIMPSEDVHILIPETCVIIHGKRNIAAVIKLRILTPAMTVWETPWRLPAPHLSIHFQGPRHLARGLGPGTATEPGVRWGAGVSAGHGFHTWGMDIGSVPGEWVPFWDPPALLKATLWGLTLCPLWGPQKCPLAWKRARVGYLDFILGWGPEANGKSFRVVRILWLASPNPVNSWVTHVQLTLLLFM